MALPLKKDFFSRLPQRIIRKLGLFIARRRIGFHNLNKNDHRSGGAVKEGCPYLCIKHIIKLKNKNKMSLFNICVNCAIRRIKGLSSFVN